MSGEASSLAPASSAASGGSAAAHFKVFVL